MAHRTSGTVAYVRRVSAASLRVLPRDFTVISSVAFLYVLVYYRRENNNSIPRKTLLLKRRGN